MGQKVNPIGFRLAVNKDWRSKWYATGKDYTDKLHEDLAIRKYLHKQPAVRRPLQGRHRARLEQRARHAPHLPPRPDHRPQGRGDRAHDQGHLRKLCGGAQVKIDIIEIRKPELDAQLVAENVAVQLERRISFRRAMKRAVQTTMDFGAEGIRIRCAGRLGGADIARAEWYREGKVPLQTLRVPIDYGFAEARTVYGIIGVKCWINKKEERRPPGGRRGRGDRAARGDRRWPDAAAPPSRHRN